MPRIIRVHDPDEAERRVHIRIKEGDYPGILQLLGSLPHGAESVLIRSVLYQWYLLQKERGTLENTIETFLAELNSKKRVGGLKVEPSFQRDTSLWADVPKAVAQSGRLKGNLNPSADATGIEVRDRTLPIGVSTDQGAGSAAAREVAYSEKVSASRVDNRGIADEIDPGMLDDIRSFLDRPAT